MSDSPIPPYNHPRPHMGPAPDEQTSRTERYEDILYDFLSGEIAAKNVSEREVQFFSENGFSLSLSQYPFHILRCRFSFDLLDKAPFSYALDPKLPEQQANTLDLKESSDHWQINSPAFQVQLSKENLTLQLSDAQGERSLFQQTAPLFLRKTTYRGITAFRISQSIDPEKRFFGLGDKAGPLQLNGQSFTHWNTDAFAYGEQTDPLYKSIPFYYCLQKGHCYGLFLNNPYPSRFDFGQADPEHLSIEVPGGPLDLFFLPGPTPADVARQYALLTGRHELPPIWALGFHQCRWSYFPESRLLEVAREFRQRNIPCDALYLDIDYMDGFRCFTWDESHFPKPEQMVNKLKEQGFRTVAMIDPGIKQESGYWVYDEGMEKDVFCRRTNGDLMTGPVWPGMCVFPDYTRPDVRGWWGKLYRELYTEIGIHGFWNDMNEPAVFKVNTLTFPDEVRHDFEGHPSNHQKAHNIYGQQMARATFEGLKQLVPDRRPFVITRATFSGGQRHAWSWTGDNIASWEHLRIANRQCQRMSVSGFPFVGTDIGGFVGQPSGELFVRWLQLALFHPLFRVHSAGNNEDGTSPTDPEAVHKLEILNRLDQEPWSFGPKWEALARQAIEWRYRLLGYWYTTVWEYVQTGSPVLSHLFFADPQDEELPGVEDGFLFGKQLLAWPVLYEGAEELDIYLPQGNWFMLENGVHYSGGQQLKLPVRLETIPVFAKAGTIIPLYPVMQYTGEKPIKEIELRVFFSEGNHQSQLYTDEGDGYAYQNEHYLLRSFELEGNPESLQISQQRAGLHTDNCDAFLLKIFGLPFVPVQAEVDGQIREIAQDGDACIIQVAANFENLRLLQLP